MRNLEELNQKHAGKVAFVLGSGPSVNMLDISPLKDFVTIAVNSAYVGMPEADYFISDDWSVARWSYFFNDLRISKVTTALLYEDMLKNDAWQFGNRAVMFRHRKGYRITDKYEHENPDNFICQARTSAGSAIHVAHIMGCSKIVLIGIDCCRMDTLRYFWGKQGSVTKRPYRNDSIPEDHYRRTLFENKQTDTDLVDITHYWRSKASYFNEKCQIFNASPISILTEFPTVNLQEFLINNEQGKKNV